MPDLAPTSLPETNLSATPLLEPKLGATSASKHRLAPAKMLSSRSKAQRSAAAVERPPSLPRTPAPTRFPYRRALQALSVCLLAVTMLGASDPESRFNSLGHKMVCACSCGQILLECNHVGCPDSARMITELRQNIATDLPDSGIFNWFVNKYGAVILAAPIRGGFDTVAWIAPIAVFLFGTLGTAILVRRWTRRTGSTLLTSSAATLTPEHQAMRDRIRRETQY